MSIKISIKMNSVEKFTLGLIQHARWYQNDRLLQHDHFLVVHRDHFQNENRLRAPRDHSGQPL